MWVFCTESNTTQVYTICVVVHVCSVIFGIYVSDTLQRITKEEMSNMGWLIDFIWNEKGKLGKNRVFFAKVFL